MESVELSRERTCAKGRFDKLLLGLKSMCGIVGIVGPGHREWIRAANDSQRHRGPDDEGYAFDDSCQVALAMRRLSIVDVAGGHQPMVDASGRYTIVFNGEIVNAPALRVGLEARGIRFKTNASDTEVVLNLFATYGERMLEMLAGMFAFAIFDGEARTLFLARDPLGIKPLYYFQKGETFAFASELKSLTILPMIPKELDVQSLRDYLTFQFIPAPASIFQGLRKLSAGEFMKYSIPSREAKISPYWSPTNARVQPSEASVGDVTERLRSMLVDISAEWTMSDVPIGCSLSGGIDSAAIVGLLANGGVRHLKTWTLGFEEDDGGADDERRLAKLVADRWQTDHHEIVIKASSLLSDLDAMVWHLDEPYGGGLPSWYVFREMSKEVKVAMVGTGGDELFGNYGKWRVLEPFTMPWLKQLRRRLVSHGISEYLRYPHGALYPGYFGERQKRNILLEGAGKFESSSAKIEALWKLARTDDIKEAVAFVDLRTQLPEEFLLMTDRFSMAWSVEARPPLLDRRLVELALGIPSSVRSPGKVLKQALIESVKDLLPPELLHAKKRGFVLPIAGWLRNQLVPLLHVYFGRSFLRKQGVFRDDLFDLYMKPHIQRQADYSWQIWTLLMFQLWWAKNLDSSSQ